MTAIRRTPRAPSVIVVGSINVDLIVHVLRLPAPGETVTGGRFVQQGGGKSANQAAAAARFGAKTVLVGAVGDDELGADALATLAAGRVDVSRCRRLRDAATGVAIIAVDPAGENQIAVASGANAALDGAMVDEALARVEPGEGAVCLLGFEVGDDPLVAAARWAAARQLRVVLNPAPARPLDRDLVGVRPILTPNRSEAAAMSGLADPSDAARALARQCGAAVIVTLGANGALLVPGPGEALRHLPAYPATVVDTTGAGDAFNGILAAELARGSDLETSVRWAMAGAALSTEAAGARAALPTRTAVRALVQG